MAKLARIGQIAPDFKLLDKNENVVCLSEIDTPFKVVYFYPKDSTPGCTIQAQQFTKDLGKLKKLGVSVVGISGGDSKTKEKFCAKYKLKVPLVSDTDFSVSKKYGVYGEKTFMGRKFLGINRVTFLLDGENTILKVWEKASPQDNSREILDEVKALKANTK